jgi:type II secretory pathway component PulC
LAKARDDAPRQAPTHADRGWGTLGLRDGDVLRFLNGHDFSRPQSALQLFERLRFANTLYLQLERRGVRRVQVYLVVQKITSSRPSR